MKQVLIMDMKRKWPTMKTVVENDANPYFLIDAYVKANGGKPYKAGMSSSAYYGRFWVEEKPVTE